ncbi:type IV pilus modification protein PilV [Luteimonas padinae]|uniref:Type IV pilus modification protein PilV n=1 Tax=Luteimonas padinae TaxID=1714359 RepID=A0ABV6SW40_9GAMM|nr:type IV pilus modification protein PilV [Luteimonas padinae]GHD74848.1 type IV pilus modification protein PilV [Luteimonas padinae]
MPTCPISRKQRGATMLEVLITVLILAIGLLGVAAMQMMALRNSQQSHQQSMATIFSYSILDSMRANVDAARNGDYNVTRLCTAPVNTATLAQKDQAYWLAALKAQLGSGACGAINCQGGDCTASVSWTDSRGGNDSGLVSTRTRL